MFDFRKIFARRLDYGRMAVRDRFSDIKNFVKSESPLVIDGGANRGSMIDRFLKQYRSPTIHAFEPIPELAAELETKYRGRDNVSIHNAAIGAENKTVSFNVLNYDSSSSVFTPSEINRGYHGAKMELKRSVDVRMLRLDEVLDEDVDIMKLDLQGYELEALKGCGGLLDRIKSITAEVEFVPLYEDQPLFSEIDIYLRSKGFVLLNLYELYTHPDGQLTSGDAVYLNSRYC